MNGYHDKVTRLLKSAGFRFVRNAGIDERV